jgi:hypothetical protein
MAVRMSGSWLCRFLFDVISPAVASVLNASYDLSERRSGQCRGSMAAWTVAAAPPPDEPEPEPEVGSSSVVVLSGTPVGRSSRAMTDPLIAAMAMSNRVMPAE